MRTIALVLLLGLAGGTAGAAQANRPWVPLPGWLMGEVTPQGRLLLLLGHAPMKLQGTLRAYTLRSMTTAEFTTASAEARLPGQAPEPALGDRFQITLDGSGRIGARVSGFAIAHGFDNNGTYLGAWLQLDPAGSAAVQAAGTGPFVAQRWSDGTGGAGPGRRRALFNPTLTDGQRAVIAQTLTRRMLQTLPRYLALDQAAHDHVHSGLDAALLADPGQPKLSTQGIRLADGDNRLFVRAEWDAGNVPGFILSAWLSDQPVPKLLSIDLSGADKQRDEGFGSAPAEQGMGLVTPLLRVVYLGDGRTVVLRAYYGDESSSVNGLLYSDQGGLAFTTLSHGQFLEQP